MSKPKLYLSTLHPITINWVFLVALLFSCTEPEEGCIDVLASNFEINADDDCCADTQEECCCTFPTLRLNLFYKGVATDTLSNASSNIRLDTYYPLDNLGDSIRIDSFSMFVSDLTPFDNIAGDSLSVIEILEITTIDGDGQTITNSLQDNIALVEMPLFQFTVGTFRSDISIDEISFNLGLGPNLVNIDPTSVDNDHPLGNEYTVLFDNTAMQYLVGRIGFTLKRGLEERIIVQNLESFESFSEQFVNPTFVDRGSTLDIRMRINILDVFKGIVFDIPNVEIPVLINENLSTSISILE